LSVIDAPQPGGVPPTNPAANKPASIEAIKAQIDLAKLVITLASGGVAFTVTFLEKFVAREEGAAISTNGWLLASWAAFGAAIFFALMTLSALVATLEAIDRKANDWAMTQNETDAASGGDAHSRWSAFAMFVAFFVGVVLMIVAAARLG
jgi:hypothetical protein